MTVTKLAYSHETDCLVSIPATASHVQWIGWPSILDTDYYSGVAFYAHNLPILLANREVQGELSVDEEGKV